MLQAFYKKIETERLCKEIELHFFLWLVRLLNINTV